jgi:hypothetical protein
LGGYQYFDNRLFQISFFFSNVFKKMFNTYFSASFEYR